ncbi:MAG: ERCC4 domain-containing protein [Christensenellales bacterium]
MTIQIDSREKPQAIKTITAQFDRRGVKWFVSKLPVGDYMSLDNARLVIDRKRRLEELCMNCGTDHERFSAELAKAGDLGIKLILLVEHGPLIKSLEDVHAWQNPLLKAHPTAMTGARLAQILDRIQRKYAVDIIFCQKCQTGNRIMELLGFVKEPYHINIGANTGANTNIG